MEVSGSVSLCLCEVDMQLWKHRATSIFFSSSSDVDIRQVLIRLIGADENMHSNYTDTIQCLEDADILEMIVDKFRSSVCDMSCIIILE